MNMSFFQKRYFLKYLELNEPLPGVLGNTGTVAFIFREQGIFSNYFQGTGELLTRLLGSFLGTRGFSNGEQGIKSKKVKGSWEHAPPPPWEGLLNLLVNILVMRY